MKKLRPSKVKCLLKVIHLVSGQDLTLGLSSGPSYWPLSNPVEAEVQKWGASLLRPSGSEFMSLARTPPFLSADPVINH